MHPRTAGGNKTRYPLVRVPDQLAPKDASIAAAAAATVTLICGITRLAETRLAQYTLNYLKLNETNFKQFKYIEQ